MFTSILLIVSGLILLVLLLQSTPRAKALRQGGSLNSEMELAATIAQTSAKRAFNIDLPLDDESVALLDELIEQYWPGTPQPETQNTQAIDDTSDAHEPSVDDPFYVTAAFIGELLVRNHAGHWRQDESAHQLPFVFFERADIAASPFDLLRKKVDEPFTFKLQSAYARLLREVERHEQALKETSVLTTEHLASEAASEQSGMTADTIPSSVETPSSSESTSSHDILPGAEDTSPAHPEDQV